MNVLDVIAMTALTATLINTALTLLVLWSDFKSTLHRVYVLWGISVTLWNLGVYHLSQDIPPDEAFWWAKVLQFGVISLPVNLFYLAIVVSGTDRLRRIMPALYLIAGGFTVSLFCNKFIVGVRKLDVGYWSVPGPGFHLFGIFYTVLILSLLGIMYLKQRRAPALQKKRIRALLFALVGVLVFGSNDLLPILGYDHYPGTHIKFFPMGSLAAVFYVVVIAYSVLQHRVLDVHLTLGRHAAQIVRLTFMMLIGFSLLLFASWMFPSLFTIVSFVAALGALFLSAAAASLLFPQFFGKGTDKLERQILGDHFEYHARVQSFIDTLRSFPEPDHFVPELDELLVMTVKAKGYQLALLDETTRGFRLFHAYPAQPEVNLADWQVDSPVFRYFQQTRAKYLSCSLQYETTHESLLQRMAREQVKVFDPEFAFPFFSGEELVGFLLLGGKTSGDLYTPHDLHLLGDLSTNLGLALDQVRLRQQLQVAHEQDLLGRMSRGLAHDLNNLLTPVQTLLQLCQESGLNQDTLNELLPMALKNLETVRAYVKEALFFSRNAKINGVRGSLNEAVREAVALTSPGAESKNITVTFHDAPDTYIEMDSVLIKRLICNLLSNAVDASPEASKIDVELSALPRTEMSRDWFRLKVIDRGEGIDPQDLQRVFTPYFTTKNTGDGKRGFGLGLAISRKIVHLHGGNLSINSKLKKGTTVQVDLPNRLTPGQSPAPAAETSSERMGAAAA